MACDGKKFIKVDSKASDCASMIVPQPKTFGSFRTGANDGWDQSYLSDFNKKK